MRKKLCGILLFFMVLIIPLMACSKQETDSEGPQVTVTISDGSGSLPLAGTKVTVYDVDKDGVMTLNDALSCAHEAYFPDGVDGYGSAESEFGLSMTKLWGVENGGSYGYYINNQLANSLSDAVQDGDEVVAFVYVDTQEWSDCYAFFDSSSVSVEANVPFSLTLNYYAYDENWNMVSTPATGAHILANGEDTGLITDDKGTVELVLPKDGRYVISAKSDSVQLVPPCCIAVVGNAGDEPSEGSTLMPYWIALAVIVVIGGAVLAYRYVRRKKVRKA